MKPIIQNRAVLILGIAESVSGIGNWITAMAVFALVIFRSDGTPLQSSGIYLAGLLPILVFSPLAGSLVDRFDRKKLLIWGELSACLAVIGLMMVEELAWIYLLLALHATFSAIITPARQASIPNLVSREDLTRTNAFLQQLSGIIKISAPILAGALLAVITPHQAMLLDVMSFIFAAVILTRLPTLPPEIESKNTSQTPNHSVGYILRQEPLLLMLFGMMFMFITIIMSFDILSSIFTRDVLHGDESLYGILIGLVGIGTVIAAAGLMFRKQASDPWMDIFKGLLLLGCIPMALVFATLVDDLTLRRAVVLVGCLIGGIGNGLLNTQIGTLLQLLSPAAWLGRISGAFQSTLVAGQLISLAALPFIVPDVLPMSVFFTLASVIIILATVGAIIGVQRLRHPEHAIRNPA